jgi:hypothetical protein
MFVFVCTDGVVRIGDGGGLTAYAGIDEIAGLDVPLVPIDITIEQLGRALDSVGKSWWARMLDRIVR